MSVSAVRHSLFSVLLSFYVSVYKSVFVSVSVSVYVSAYPGPDQVNHRGGGGGGGFRRGSRGPHRPPGGVKGLFFCFVSFREGTCIG